MTNNRVYKMAFSKVYPLLVQKAERKGRTKAEVDAVICWLTGYDDSGLQAQIEKNIDYETFFSEAPQINPNAAKIKGVICHRVEKSKPAHTKIRWLDKLVDRWQEQANGEGFERLSEWLTLNRLASMSLFKAA